MNKDKNSVAKYLIITLMIVIFGILSFLGALIIKSVAEREYYSTLFNNKEDAQAYIENRIENKYNRQFTCINIEKGSHNDGVYIPGVKTKWDFYNCDFRDVETGKTFEVTFNFSGEYELKDSFPKVLYSDEIEKEFEKILNENSDFIYERGYYNSGWFILSSKNKNGIEYYKISDKVSNKKEYIEKGGVTFIAHATTKKYKASTLADNIYNLIIALESKHYKYMISIEISGIEENLDLGDYAGLSKEDIRLKLEDILK